ncbi:hypothetical protein [Cellulosimicrobium arenosum]|uniref:hypothetical protein n=1 Tax=Cellulosimicrobium arenosum TaxID=2708133 RepID=UPI0019D71A38|nr:hypothetical protein [Cellulosimicrobium arenosum]
MLGHIAVSRGEKGRRRAVALAPGMFTETHTADDVACGDAGVDRKGHECVGHLARHTVGKDLGLMRDLGELTRLVETPTPSRTIARGRSTCHRPAPFLTI